MDAMRRATDNEAHIFERKVSIDHQIRLLTERYIDNPNASLQDKDMAIRNIGLLGVRRVRLQG